MGPFGPFLREAYKGEKNYKILVEQLLQYTVWKFQGFSITQILCEINFAESRSSKTAFFGIVRGLPKVEKCIKIKIQSLLMC